MPSFIATEFEIGPEIKPTGNAEVYLADDAKSAAKSCLYTKQLSDGRAYMGPTGLCVYSKGKGWTVTPEKRQP